MNSRQDAREDKEENVELGDVLVEAVPGKDVLEEDVIQSAVEEPSREARVVMLGLPGPSKPIHDYPVCRSPVPRAKCHRHIDTVFVVAVLVVMLILVIIESVSKERSS